MQRRCDLVAVALRQFQRQPLAPGGHRFAPPNSAGSAKSAKEMVNTICPSAAVGATDAVSLNETFVAH
jgi:hypothetical protein